MGLDAYGLPLSAGVILQVKQTSRSDNVTLSGSITYLTLTVTPKSRTSTIALFGYVHTLPQGAGEVTVQGVYKNSIVLLETQNVGDSVNTNYGSPPFLWFDTGVAANTTYTVVLSSSANTGLVASGILQLIEFEGAAEIVTSS